MLPYFYDPPYNMAARPVPKAAHGCPHKQLGAAGDIETKRAAKAGYAPAMYHMHMSYAARAAQIAAEYPLRAAEMVLHDKYKLKSEYWLREARLRDPGGAAHDDRHWVAIYAAQDIGDYQLMRSLLNVYLEHLAPQCCKVYYELGRVCKALGLGPESKKHFEAAAVLTRRDIAARGNISAWRASVP